MKLDYIYHSGFAIEADGVTVIIDYSTYYARISIPTTSIAKFFHGKNCGPTSATYSPKTS